MINRNFWIEKIKKKIPLFFKLQLIKTWIYTKKTKNIEVEFTTNKPKMYILLATDYPNLGDHALTIAHKNFLHDHFPEFEIIEFSVDSTLDAIYFLKNNLSDNDVITLKGGGNIGIEYFREELLRRKIIKTFINNPIILFPQTVYFPDTSLGKKEFRKTTSILNSHSKLTIFLRDQVSFDLLKKEKVKNIYLVPDIVFSFNSMVEKDGEDKNALVCLRDDREKAKGRLELEWILKTLQTKNYFEQITDTVVNYNVDFQNREEILQNMLSDFSKAKLVVTDRLHGMIFSYIVKTPCLVLGTYNHKVTGQYQWLKNSNAVYLVGSKEEFIESLSTIEKIYKESSFYFPEVSSKHQLIEKVMRSRII